MEGFEIPMGADLSAMQAAFDKVIAAVDRMGDRIVAALEKTNSAAMKTTGSMGKLSTGSAAVGTAADQAGTKSEGAGKKLMTLARGAIAVGGAMGNVSQALGGVGQIMTSLSSENFGTMLANAAKIGNGLKSAMTSVWGAMKRVGENKSLLKIAAGAAAGVAGVLLLRQAFRTVVGALNLLKNSVAAVFRGMVNAAKASARAIGNAFSAVASLPGKMLSLPGLPLAGIISAAGAMALLVTQMKAGAETAGEVERLAVAFTALTGSNAGSDAILASMRENWVKTGTAISEQAPTIQKFLALGFSSADALKLQKNILDVAGAVGMTAAEAGLLGTALAQVKAKGVVSMEELRQQIAEKGVPIFEALAAKLGVTQAALIKLVSDGKVPAETLIDIFLNMEGSLARFRGGADRMGSTFLGLVSRIQGAWSLFRAEFMAPVIDALKPILETGIARIQTLMSKARELGQKVGNAISIVFTAFRDGSSMELFKAGLAVAFHGAVDILSRGLRGTVAFLATALPPIFETVWAKLRDPSFWEGISLLLQSAAAAFGAEINKALGRTDLAESLERQSGLQAQHGAMLIANSGNPDSGAIISSAMEEAMQKFKEAAGGPQSQAFQDANKVFQEAFKKLQETVDKDRAARAAAAASEDETDTEKEESPLATVNKAVQPAVMSLTRIGGGGFAASVMGYQLAESRKQTALLKKVVDNTSNPKYGGPAVFA
jgi:tape measure domain-containing protein